MRAYLMKVMLLLYGLFCLPSAWAGEGVNDHIQRFNAHATYPIPLLTESQIQRLQEGKLVRIREVPKDKGQPQRGIGLKLIPQPRKQLWVGAIDPHMSSKAAASEVAMSRPDGGARWYQRLWLPWPFSQRHWVIDVNDTHALAVATSGKAWEHHWSLTPNGETLAKELIAAGSVDGISSKDAEGFVYTPVNRGAYFAMEMGTGKTLWGFHATTVVGGNISDRLIADFTMMQLKGLFQDTIERGEKASSHYDAAHAPLVGGDGAEIPRF